MVRLIRCTALHFVRQVFENPRSSSGLSSFAWNQKQSTYRQLHTIRHVNRSVWLAREAKPRSGAGLERSTHDYETPLLSSIIVPLE